MFKAGALLKKIRKESPLVYHLTNWVTIYDCANIVKVLGASVVMAHAPEEAGEMSSLAQALVLNIGTLTSDFVEAMKIAARAANRKGIPVILDVCGLGATRLRSRKSSELLTEARIDIIKGNASEIASLCGESVVTRGVDTAKVEKDLVHLAKKLAQTRKCTVAITGKEDIVASGDRVFLVANGHPLMADIVGTGCMASSLIGTFSAVEKDLAKAASCALACFGAAGETAARKSQGPGSFKERLFDELYSLSPEVLDKKQRIKCA